MVDRVLLEEAGTFMGVPPSRDLSNSKAAVLGIPFDCGVHPTRIGSRLGPQAIRQHSGLVRRYEPPFRDYDPLARLGLVDRGNVRLRPSFGSIIRMCLSRRSLCSAQLTIVTTTFCLR